MECRQKINSEKCTCTKISCSRKGRCCECIKHHLAKRQLPGCCFDKGDKAVHDKSFERFAALVKEGKI